MENLLITLENDKLHFNNLNQLFDNQTKFEDHFENLWKTRAGLYHILTERPDLKETVGNQFNTLNKMIDALIKDTGYCYQTNEYLEQLKNKR